MRLVDLRTLSLLVLLAILAGCGTSQPTRYYLLSSSVPDTVLAPAQRELTVGVGPVILPPYLERRELVSRTGSNELRVAVYYEWAEPLEENFSRVLREDLGQRLDTDRIIPLPVKRSLRKALDVDYQVVVAVRNFEKSADGSVLLNARWMILDNDKTELVLRRSEYRQIPAGDDYAAQAAAQSQVLGRLSEEIAAAIMGLVENSGHKPGEKP
jgi:uncharacterized lipoprotein YmbA